MSILSKLKNKAKNKSLPLILSTLMGLGDIVAEGVQNNAMAQRIDSENKITANTSAMKYMYRSNKILSGESSTYQGIGMEWIKEHFGLEGGIGKSNRPYTFEESQKFAGTGFWDRMTANIGGVWRPIWKAKNDGSIKSDLQVRAGMIFGHDNAPYVEIQNSEYGYIHDLLNVSIGAGYKTNSGPYVLFGIGIGGGEIVKK